MATDRAARTKASASATVEDRPTQLIEIASRLFATAWLRRHLAARHRRASPHHARPRLYYHFPNKEALYEQIVVDNPPVAASIASSDAVEQADGATEQVRVFHADRGDASAAPDAWIAGSNVFWSQHGSADREAAVGRRDRFEKLLRGCIAKGVGLGRVSDLDAGDGGALLLSTLNQMTRWISPTGAG